MERRSFVTTFTSNSGIVIAQGETDTVAGLFVAGIVRGFRFCDYRARLLHECKAGCGCIGASSLSLPNLLGKYIRSLLHEGADGEPHGVFQVEIIFQFLRIRVARMRIVPFSWRHSVDKEFPLRIPLNATELFSPFLENLILSQFDEA